jgi:alpha-L-fucosidase
MTICRQWAWKPDDTMKSLEQCLQTLMYTAGGDGNLLFNVGPMPDGRIEPRQVERLTEMGRWMQKYGDTIYGTRGGPVKPGRWGASTCKGNRINLFVMNWPKDGPLVIPGSSIKVTQASLRTGGTATVRQTADGLAIDVSAADRKEIATIVELTVEGPAFDIEPVGVPVRSDSAAFQKKATASNTFQNQATYGPGRAFDDDPETRWATDAGLKSAWLEVDLGVETAIDAALIDEHTWDRIRKYEIQYQARLDCSDPCSSTSATKTTRPGPCAPGCCPCAPG